MADEEDSSPTEASGWFSDRALQHRAIQTKVQEAIVRHNKANRANDNGAGEDIVDLRTGDLIYLQRTPGDEQSSPGCPKDPPSVSKEMVSKYMGHGGGWGGTCALFNLVSGLVAS